MDKHLKTCSKREQTIQIQQNGHKSATDYDQTVQRLSLIEENLMMMRKSLNEEIQMRHTMISELGNIQKRNQINDEWTIKASEVLNLLQKRIEEEKESRTFDIKDLNGIIDNLSKQFQVRFVQQNVSILICFLFRFRKWKDSERKSQRHLVTWMPKSLRVLSIAKRRCRIVMDGSMKVDVWVRKEVKGILWIIENRRQSFILLEVIKANTCVEFDFNGELGKTYLFFCVGKLLRMI